MLNTEQFYNFDKFREFVANSTESFNLDHVHMCPLAEWARKCGANAVDVDFSRTALIDNSKVALVDWQLAFNNPTIITGTDCIKTPAEILSILDEISYNI